MRGLTEALSIELKRFGVRASDLLPGLIDTPLLGDADARDGPEGGHVAADAAARGGASRVGGV